MPRLVDHDRRRAELVAAAIGIILREGLDGVTVRGVAAEAGWSTGSLRHYFANQRVLQEQVVRAATEELRRRVLPRAQRRRGSRDLVERIASIVEELLPLDAARREEYVLWTAIVEWERRHPSTDGSRTWRDQRALYRQCVAALYGAPTVDDADSRARSHPDPRIELWAALLHTFVDGLASQLVNTPGELSSGEARRLLRELLRAVPVV